MITVYSKDNCPQCRVAIAMLKAKGREYTVMKLGEDYTKEELMAISPNAKTFPQIFEDGTLVGGVHQLQVLLAGSLI